MSDYIKREDALEQFDYYDLGEYLTTQIRGMLMDIPSADAEPVRHEHWIDDAGALRCSFCGVRFPDLYPLYEKARYCPNCGSKMDGGDEDDD